MAGGIGLPQDSRRQALVGTSQKNPLRTKGWKKPQAFVRVPIARAPREWCLHFALDKAATIIEGLRLLAWRRAVLPTGATLEKLPAVAVVEAVSIRSGKPQT